MSELREFVADLLERQGAAVEALGPDSLEVLAPATRAEAAGLARAGASRLRNGARPWHDCDRARGRLARPVRHAPRRRGTLERAGGSAARCGSAAERPRTGARPRARPAERGLAVPGHVRNLDALPDAGVPLHRGVGREA